MKHLLFLLILLSSVRNAQAQVNSIGPSLGFNYAWLSDNANSDPRPSFNIGFVYNYSILQSSGIGLEARYSQEGFQTKIGNRTLTSSLNYLRIPLKFTYYFGALEDDFRPKIFAGPSFAFLIGGETQTLVGENIVKLNSKDLYESFDIGLQAGAGFNYRLAKLTWLNFDVAYTHGFLPVSKGNSSSEPRNRLLNLNLGVAFGF